MQRAGWRSGGHRVHTAPHEDDRKSALLLAALVVLCSAALLNSATPPGSGPEYASDAQMKLPENYRQWVYLTTGFDMSYNKAAMQMDHHMFDNVFVNPEAYGAFQQTGTWPDKTVLMLEGRMTQRKRVDQSEGQLSEHRDHGDRGACER